MASLWAVAEVAVLTVATESFPLAASLWPFVH